MRIAQRLLMATPASIGSKSSLSEALALLPPLQLYRRILRVHRKLDPEMRVLGDSYVKNEFRAHRGVENPLHIIGFLTEWQLYAQKLEGDQWAGDKLDKAKLDKMNGMFLTCFGFASVDQIAKRWFSLQISNLGNYSSLCRL
ncbi:unnamed protein product [Penicillium nalgiovense]|uniref:Succinate dehydrogenase assembly factor 3 n=1 Tax=Penicillium nalgiovense TaxID=60175 RepID=A0A9W4MUX0_PENNA|nr:unnamed protein product [Penicillium nalgiovense]CAG7963067.1 unnamed protein product [Penicillium nalgiovense]CAG7978005.1 unnamed protein product [Penicillium nalgiovense]CAG7989489.1 unnamed protein product [Penicillium nalgiovense]CAG7990088.1 unnamed protein product [Penicillium nalgiovense]